MDPLKDAFSKVKQDIDELKTQIYLLAQQMEEIKRTLGSLNCQNPTDSALQQTNQQINPTHPTDKMPLYAPISQDTLISTGNGGVPTNQQTDTCEEKRVDVFKFHPEETPQTGENSLNLSNFPVQNEKTDKTDRITQIQRVSDVLESLDSIKKEIRSNFKKLTSQEMAVFSAIYTLEEQGFVVDYSLISQKLALSETSIRDYVHRLIKKGAPIAKTKENNKKIILKISPELKKIASLQTILSLREI